MPETKNTQNSDADELFSFYNDGGVFTIRFDAIFGKPLLSVYNDFNLSSKRNFKLSAGYIKESYESIFLDADGKFKPDTDITLLALLKAKADIQKAAAEIKPEDFLTIVDSVIASGDSAILKEIRAFVDANYTLSLNEATKKMKASHKTVNEQLIISDGYAKTILCVAYLDRLFIPLISQYLFSNKKYFAEASNSANKPTATDASLSLETVNQTVFEHIFDVAAGSEATDIKNKIYKMVFSRLRQVSFSGRKFWTKALQYGITIDTAATEIYSKIITNSISKILITKGCNVVNFLSTICANQVMFLFSFNFREHYQPIDPTKLSETLFDANDSEENMSEIEKMESLLGKTDEGHLVIQTMTINNVMDTIEQKMDVSVSPQEIASVMPYIHMNPIQEQLVSLLTYEYFDSPTAIRQLTAAQYCKLVICCQKFLMARKFIYLPKILLSRCIRQRDKTILTGNKIKDKISSSKRYRDLIDTKYANAKDTAERTIELIISSIYSSTFEDANGESIFDNSAKIGAVSEEVVDLCYLI